MCLKVEVCVHVTIPWPWPAADLAAPLSCCCRENSLVSSPAFLLLLLFFASLNLLEKTTGLLTTENASFAPAWSYKEDWQGGLWSFNNIEHSFRERHLKPVRRQLRWSEGGWGYTSDIGQSSKDPIQGLVHSISMGTTTYPNESKIRPEIFGHFFAGQVTMAMTFKFQIEKS